MKLFNIYRSGLWPQHFVTVVEAKDSEEAMKIAKAMGVLNPIVGEVKDK